MPITPKGVIVHSMSEYLMWKGKKLYAKDFLKVLGLSVAKGLQKYSTPVSSLCISKPLF